MAHVEDSGGDEDQAHGRSRGSEAASLPGRKALARVRVRRRTAVCVAAAAVVLAGASLGVNHFSGGGRTSAASGNTVEYAVGHMPLVPAYTGTSLTGSPIKLSSYRGKILVLNFWWSDCSPCRAEAPTLEVAYQRYHPHGVDFLGDDVGDTVSGALAFDRADGISYPSINDPGYAFVQQFTRAAPVSATPTTAVIDRTGHVVGMIIGTLSLSELTTLIHRAGTVEE